MATLQRRVQVLFDPDKYERLESLARSENRSVGSVVRELVDDHLAQAPNERVAALRRFLSMTSEDKGATESWESTKAAIESSAYLGRGFE